MPNYLPSDIAKEIRQFAREDVNTLISIAIKAGYDLELKGLKFDAKLNTETDEVVTEVVAHIESKDGQLKDDFPLEYVTEPDGEIYLMNGDMEDNMESLKDRLLHPEIYASTSIKGTSITAAEDDSIPGEFSDDMIDDGNGFEDTLDDVADTVDDMQDQLDDIDEDDVAIEIDNNISGHYVAECDRCHGVFITAIVESDQEIEKVSGICPLCDKETDQYLKWIIKDANSDIRSNNISHTSPNQSIEQDNNL
jgi:hypothetical protein